MSVKRVLTWTSALLMGFSLQAESPAPKSEKLTVLLDWFVNPDHAPLIIARDKGFFSAEGLNVEIVVPADPSDPPKLVAAGKADIAVSYQPSLHKQVDKDIPVARIGTLIQSPLDCLMVKEDANIKALSDLKGKKIGFSTGGVEHAVLSLMLQKGGLTLKDVELVNVGWNLTPALLTGQVDGVIGVYRNFEVHQVALEGKKARHFPVEQNGVPTYDELIYISSQKNTKDPRFSKFIHALEKATAWTLKNPDAAWDVFAKSGKDLDTPLNRLAWKDTLPVFALSPGKLDKARYTSFAEFLKGKGIIGKIPPLEQWAVETQ